MLKSLDTRVLFNLASYSWHYNRRNWRSIRFCERTHSCERNEYLWLLFTGACDLSHCTILKKIEKNKKSVRMCDTYWGQIRVNMVVEWKLALFNWVSKWWSCPRCFQIIRGKFERCHNRSQSELAAVLKVAPVFWV